MKAPRLLLLLLLTGCSKPNLPEFNRLENIRILAFQTNTPEVSPGDSVTIKPIISDITATSLSFSASACMDLGISHGASATCQGNPSQIVLFTNKALSLPGVGESWTGIADSFNVVVPTAPIIFMNHQPYEIYNGVNYLIEYTMTNNQGSSVTAIKRILVSDSAKTSKNTNPTTNTIYADGLPMNSLVLGVKSTLSTDLTVSSSETYILKNSNLESLSQTEKLTTTWFVSDGETKYYRSSGVDTNVFTAPGTSPVGRSFYLLVVTRDDRGGVSLIKKKF